MSNIYKLSQDTNNGYDTYDSAIVVADNEEDAKMIAPDEHHIMLDNHKWFHKYGTGDLVSSDYDEWADYKDIKVELIGVADDRTEKGLILGSFNAG